MKRGLRQQPRIKGVTREPSSTALLPEIKRELERLANENGVTPSWRATILADALKIRRQPRYYLVGVPKKRRRRA